MGPPLGCVASPPLSGMLELFSTRSLGFVVYRGPGRGGSGIRPPPCAESDAEA